MSKLFGFSGEGDFGGPVFPNPKESALFLSAGRLLDVYFPPSKKSRVTAPFVLPKNHVSIEILPDECLFEIFRRLPGGEERSAAACVSKRWLSLLSNIRGNEICKSSPKNEETEDAGYLCRSLEGKKATDLRLAAISVGTASRGGLGKLSIRGTNKASHGVTNLGLKAVSRGCSSLKVLSLWNLPAVGDQGLAEIANECHQLEKLDISQCPGITDKGLAAIAKNCPKLTDLTIESCIHIGNDGVQAVGQSCPNLKSVSFNDCPKLTDQGISSLMSSATFSLSKVKLQALNVTDVSLAVIGHYGKVVTDLALTNLPNVGERGFWVMGHGQGLQMLKSLTITSCGGVTDNGIEAVGKGCPNLKQICLRKCMLLSDNGVASFTKAAVSLESLHLEECHRITQLGLFGTLLNCGGKLKALSLVSCFGLKDLNLNLPPSSSSCTSLLSLTIRNCPGFGDASLALLGNLCPQILYLDLSGLHGITDSGVLPLIKSCKSGLIKINLSNCLNLTDRVVFSLVELHGWTLEVLNLDCCKMITDASLSAISKNCQILSDLDVSKCAITDSGILALARDSKLNLQVLSLSNCFMVSDKSLPSLRKLGQTLLGLNIQNCKSISHHSVDLLLEQLWRCDILY
ncbi:EIN3-binding F-box protein 1 [Rutidosis leptorrhynchoides]|uniref:EIN3-binding F-box protein 1 n=1 Tax=Rutidosis leptorrhynchoides TaxID=125765 RepID=UPI003A9925DD